jgi:hypothetical protein
MASLVLVSSPYIDYGSWLDVTTRPRLSPYIPIGLLSLAASAREKLDSVQLFDTNDYWNVYGHGRRLSHLYLKTAEAIFKNSGSDIKPLCRYRRFHD